VDDVGRIQPGGALFPLLGRAATSMAGRPDLPDAGLAINWESPTPASFLGELLIERLAAALQVRQGDTAFNICFAGDLALEPALNSALRDQTVVRAMWVPPFPDDTGSAIGAAALRWARPDGLRQLDWRIRLGREVERHLHQPAGWSVRPCRPEELARLLHRTGNPVVILDGRAKFGSRGLGARSILAPATDPGPPAWIRSAGQPGDPRPLAAICLAESAPDVFDPGTPDPYQLFQHRVRAEWVDRLPALRHPGGAARLQTVGGGDDRVLATVLREYRSWSGIPLLCGVTAGLPGSGPFPDVVSAMRWAGVDQVWSDGLLHRRVRDSAG
jgi:carbamoyltransferase